MRSEVAVRKFDMRVIHAIRRCSIPLARLSLFLVFFWFGLLKVIYISPANPLIDALLQKILPFVSFERFIILFGIYEMIIGVVFLLPHFERLAIALLIPHMVTTFLPLVLLPVMTWQGFLIPTLEGQYIIKNLVIVALALGIAAHLHPLSFHGKR